MTGRPLDEILSMATEIPGRFVGDRGRLQIGGRADLIRFRWTDAIAVEDVWLNGRRIESI